MRLQGWQPPPKFAWLQALREPELTLGWSMADWDRVVRLARRLRLLSRLAERVADAGLIDRIPAPVRAHLVGEQRLSRWRIQALVWGLDRIGAVFGDATYPRVLLKGAAYIGQGLPIAPGRLPSDLDILVPLAYLPDALARLEAAGWSAGDINEHDSRYYREWSHEVPPMTHPLQRVELDLHHNILPPVARTHVNADLLLDRLQPSRWTSWQVLDPMDQVLHSAAHLFLDSDLRDRLRDLVDLDGLVRHFGATEGFWDRLPPRAQTLGLSEELALACHFCTRWLGTPVPETAQRSIARLGPQAIRRARLLSMFAPILTPTEPDDAPARIQGLASTVLLTRYHYNRLPLRLLVPHLWYKWRTGQALGGKGDSAG
jgi:hypothetical protein